MLARFTQQLSSLRLTGVFDNKLSSYRAVPEILFESICHVDIFGQGFCTIEPDGVKALTVSFDTEFQVLVFKQALLANAKCVAKDWCWKASAPHMLREHAGHFGVGISGLERPVGFDDRFKAGPACQRLHRLVKTLHKD